MQKNIVALFETKPKRRSELSCCKRRQARDRHSEDQSGNAGRYGRYPAVANKLLFE